MRGKSFLEKFRLLFFVTVYLDMQDSNQDTQRDQGNLIIYLFQYFHICVISSERFRNHTFLKVHKAHILTANPSVGLNEFPME